MGRGACTVGVSPWLRRVYSGGRRYSGVVWKATVSCFVCLSFGFFLINTSMVGVLPPKPTLNL